MMAPDESQADSEVEITPQMIKAGLTALYNWDERFELEDELMKSIWRAMVKAKTQA